MTRRELLVPFQIEGRNEIQKVRIDSQATIEDLLQKVRDIEKIPDLVGCFIRGMLRDPDDLVRDFINDGQVYCLTRHYDEDRPPAEVQLEGDPELLVTIKPKEEMEAKTEYTLFTNLNCESFMHGCPIELDAKSDADMVKQAIYAKLNQIGVRVPDGLDMEVFLPGGVPFLALTLSDWYQAMNQAMDEKHIFALFLNGDVDIFEQVEDVCDCSSEQSRQLLSPLFDSTELGLARTACFLGYFANDGAQAENMFISLCHMVKFAPMITSLVRLVYHQAMSRLDVMAITGCLPVLIRYVLEQGFEGINRFEDRKILEQVFFLGNFLVELDAPQEDIHIQYYKVSDNDDGEPLGKYCRDGEIEGWFAIWHDDMRTSEWAELGFDGKLSRGAYRQVEEIITFRELSAVTCQCLYSPAMLKGVRTPCLFIGNVDRDTIQIIDPMRSGKARNCNVSEFVRETGNDRVDEEVVKSITGDQVIMICADQSISMNHQLNGKQSGAGKTRGQIASQCIEAFIKRSWAYRTGSTLGVLTFSDKVDELLPFTAQRPREGLCTVEGKAAGTVLWDALHAACVSICNYVGEDEGENGEEYQYLRIVVISDGEDEGSQRNFIEIAQELVDHRIVVDGVLISSVDDNEKLRVMCEITGGLAFRVNTEDEAKPLFEREAFLNMGIRENKAPLARVGMTSDEMHNLWEERLVFYRTERGTGFSADAPNQEVLEGSQRFSLATPLYMCSQSDLVRGIENLKHRQFRIMCELTKVQQLDNENIVVWCNSGYCDKWRVFLKSAKGKWWSLVVSFPRSYPVVPPRFRFVEPVPVHPNISVEGRVLFSWVDFRYRGWYSISEILVKIHELLSTPELATAINVELAELYQSNRAEFDRRAEIKEEEAENSPDDYQFMNGIEKLEGGDGDEMNATLIRTVTDNNKLRPMSLFDDDL